MILSREKILESKSSISIEIDEPTLKKCFAFLFYFMTNKKD